MNGELLNRREFFSLPKRDLAKTVFAAVTATASVANIRSEVQDPHDFITKIDSFERAFEISASVGTIFGIAGAALFSQTNEMKAKLPKLRSRRDFFSDEGRTLLTIAGIGVVTGVVTPLAMEATGQADIHVNELTEAKTYKDLFVAVSSPPEN